MRRHADSSAVLVAVEGYVPEIAVGNEYFTSRLDTTDEWIRTRTGIQSRFWVPPNVSTGDLAVNVGRLLIDRFGAAGEIELLILCTTTPDHLCPATAPDVAYRLGLGNVPAFDISAVCSGFVYGLSVAVGFIKAGIYNRVLLIAAEAYSLIVDKTDRTTSVLFGDGSGAALLRRGVEGEAGEILGFDLGSDGRYKSSIIIPDGGARSRSSDREAISKDTNLRMNGREVFDLAVRRMGGSIENLLRTTEWQRGDVDWLVAHQANHRILRTLAEYTGIHNRKVVNCIEKFGNTSAASILIALRDAARLGTFREGDRILLTAFGGGVTWGSACLTWPHMEN